MIVRNDIIYFLGIGGIGMSALARWCNNRVAQIYGYDLQPSKLTDELKNEGMVIHFEPDTSEIPDNVSLVVYTPAIPKDNIELNYFIRKETPIIKRAELIGKITRDYNTIAIAGTHGKTSISALTAHLLKNAGVNITAFVGGVCRNYNTNLILSKSTDYLIIEADEYDRSLLQIDPNIAVISSTDEDHLDIYNDHADIKSTFIEFAKKLRPDGILIYNSKLDAFNELACKKLTYDAEKTASIHAANIRVEYGKFVIDIVTQSGKIFDVEIQVPGIHNIENTLAAVSIAVEVGLTLDAIKKGIESFAGVERRMDYRINNEDLIYIDDYAHHPEEIKATISAVKKLYPDKKITGIFQPHLYSRTRDFSNEFAIELSRLDEIILLDIYPAREKPIEGVSSSIILDSIIGTKSQLLSKHETLEYISNNKPEVLLTMGAGDIGLLVGKIETELIKN